MIPISYKEAIEEIDQKVDDMPDHDLFKEGGLEGFRLSLIMDMWVLGRIDDEDKDNLLKHYDE